MSTRTILLLGVVLFFLAACGQAQPPAQTSSPTVEPAASAVTADESAAPTGQKVTLGLGYIPNVQFAPFYLASEKGYYAEEGLDVEISYGGNVNDLLLQVAGGKLPFVAASGDEVLLARSQQVPVRMVFLLYQKMPVAVFSK